MKSKEERQRISVRKELEKAEKQEERLKKQALEAEQKGDGWRKKLEGRVPDQVYGGLQAAFYKAFQMIFERGTGVIEKSFNGERLKEDHAVRDFTFQVKGDRGSLKRLRKGAGRLHGVNLALTSAEGIGLGIFGIGLPDIAVFTGVLLKGVYETALYYGFDYEGMEERYFILKLMETAVSKGNLWVMGNEELDEFLAGRGRAVDGQLLREQLRKTAEAFAVDMVFLKFIQGLPVVGVIGGAGNPYVYRKVMRYVEIKYRKRYLQGKEGKG